MAAIKLHAGVFSDNGAESCDFRGDKFIGAEQGDHHRTISEIDPASDAQIEQVLSFGPEINRLLDAMVPAEGFGVEAGLRIGVWDE